MNGLNFPGMNLITSSLKFLLEKSFFSKYQVPVKVSINFKSKNRVFWIVKLNGLDDFVSINHSEIKHEPKYFIYIDVINNNIISARYLFSYGKYAGYGYSSMLKMNDNRVWEEENIKNRVV